MGHPQHDLACPSSSEQGAGVVGVCKVEHPLEDGVDATVRDGGQHLGREIGTPVGRSQEESGGLGVGPNFGGLSFVDCLHDHVSVGQLVQVLQHTDPVRYLLRGHSARRRYPSPSGWAVTTPMHGLCRYPVRWLRRPRRRLS